MWQAMTEGVFEEADCGVRALALYHNQQLSRNCERLDSSEVWFDESATVNTFTSCTGALDNPIEQQLCSCTFFDKVTDECYWTSASSTREEIAGLCLAVPVKVATEEDKEEWGTTYDLVLDSSELEYQKDCTPLNPPGFGDIVIALVVVSLAVALLEAYVGYRRWKDPLSVRGLAVVAAAAEGSGILSIWFLLRFSRSGIQKDEVTEDQYWILGVFMFVVFGATFAGTLAEVAYYYTGAARDRFPLLGAVGNALIWLGAAFIEVLVTAYVVWRVRFREVYNPTTEDLSQAAEDELNQQTWPVLMTAAAGLIVLEALALLVMWIARALFAGAKGTLSRAKAPPSTQEVGGVSSSSRSSSAGDRRKI